MDPYTNLEDKLTDTATQLQNDGTQAAEDLQSRAREAWDSAQHQAQRAMRESTEYIRENRLPALIGAFFVGLLVGRLFARREADSFSDRYISEPLHRSRDMLMALPLAAAGAMFTDYGRSAVKSVKKAVNR